MKKTTRTAAALGTIAVGAISVAGCYPTGGDMFSASRAWAAGAGSTLTAAGFCAAFTAAAGATGAATGASAGAAAGSACAAKPKPSSRMGVAKARRPRSRLLFMTVDLPPNQSPG